MSIYITGDVHRTLDISKLIVFNVLNERNLTNKDFVIICGDFGAIWSNDESDHSVIKWYNEKPWTTLFIDGNHENHDALDKYPVVKWHGGKVHRISSKVLHLMRGQVFDIEGKTFFTMGGAQSHDMWCREEGISWWVREMPSDKEYEEGLRNLTTHNNKVDYILTHCASDHLQDLLIYGYEHNKLTNYLEVVRQTVTFNKWFCGHYHRDRILDKYYFLYNEIIKVN